MTGYRSSHLRHDCDVDRCFIALLPSWDWMDGCFPRRIRPTDIDGMVEINGHVLFLEQKRAGAGLTNGQRMAFRTLGTKPGVTVLVLRCTSTDDLFECLVFDGSEMQGYQLWSRDEVETWLKAWSTLADCTPLVGAR